MEIPPHTAANGVAPRPAAGDPALERAARDFEATFLAEMLKHSGLGSSAGTFGGGAGEEAFASFLTAEYARLLAERGGLGIAQQVFEALAADRKGMG